MLNQQETLEITQQCMKAGVNGIYQTEAVTFAGTHGKDIIESMLNKVNSETNRRTGAKLQRTAKGSRLRKLMRDYANRKADEESRWHEHNTMTKAYNESHAKGYQPTVEAIRGQLNGLLDLGDISTEEYEIGNRFLDGDESRRVGNIGDSLAGALSGVE